MLDVKSHNALYVVNKYVIPLLPVCGPVAGS